MREYIVTCKTKEDLESLYDDLETPGGSLYIPDREIELVYRRPISRNTHYLLTDEEATLISQDDRVLGVELSPEERGVKIKSSYIIEANATEDEQREIENDPTFTLSNSWSKSGNNNNSMRQWGMYRCTNEASVTNWGSDGNVSINGTVVFTSAGRNVDVVIVDGNIDPNHPEFAVNSNGSGGTRVNQFNWYSLNPQVTGGAATTYNYAINNDYTPGGDTEDNNNHGVHVAGTVAGNVRGWAPEATIYNINPYTATPSVTSSALLFDYIRVWHSTKGNNPETGKPSPTVTNHSYGLFLDIPIENVEYITYRGTTINGPVTSQQCTDVGLVNDGVTIQDIPVYSTSQQADIDDAVAEGIHFVGAAGNSTFEIDVAGGADYNNIVKEFGFTADYYNRGSSPTFLNQVICVGAIDATVAEQKATYSNSGPRIDVYAPGSNIMSALLSGGTSDNRNNGYRLGKYSGTSMAAPQVAGILATMLEHWPRMTPMEALSYFQAQGSNPWMKNFLGQEDQIVNAGNDTVTFSVTASSSQDYTFSGAASGSDPAITLTQGDIATFNLNCQGHPFWLKTQQSTGNGNEVSEGIINYTNPNRVAGTLTWDTRDVTPGTYWYQCEYHYNMANTITILPDTSNRSLQGSRNTYLRNPKIRKVTSPAGTTYIGAAPGGNYQTWPRLDNKFRPILNYGYTVVENAGDIDEDVYGTSKMIYPRHPIWNRFN